MDTTPEIYFLETVDQLRVLADERRVRICDLLGRQAMTVAQLSERLGLAHAKVHYHVRELERVGLVRLVETREKGGILEKYYQTVAPALAVPPALLRSVPPDESVTALATFLHTVVGEALEAFARDLADPTGVSKELKSLASTLLYLSDEEAGELSRRIQALLEPYEAPRGGVGERERAFVHLLYSPLADAGVAGDDQAAPSGAVVGGEPDVLSPTPTASPEPSIPAPAAAPVRSPAPGQSPSPVQSPAPGTAPAARRGFTVTVGAVSYSRVDLEHLARGGRHPTVYAFGPCTFEPDVTPELVDRTIGRFRHYGKLDATPEVLAVLRRKGEEGK